VNCETSLLQSRNKIHHSFRTAVVKTPTYPTLLFARRMIVQAFHDAMQCRNGKPTEQAVEAFDWLNGHTDWTLSGNDLIPPENLRQEFYGTFEWACRWLEEKPDHVRTHGLANVCGMGFTGGLRTVMSAWEAAEEKIGDISLSAGAVLPGAAVNTVCQKSL
jgi:hypothetical protein